jgi:hypothetical protein
MQSAVRQHGEAFGWRANACNFLIKCPGRFWPKNAGIQIGGAS